MELFELPHYVTMDFWNQPRLVYHPRVEQLTLGDVTQQTIRHLGFDPTLRRFLTSFTPDRGYLDSVNLESLERRAVEDFPEVFSLHPQPNRPYLLPEGANDPDAQPKHLLRLVSNVFLYSLLRCALNKDEAPGSRTLIGYNPQRNVALIGVELAIPKRAQLTKSPRELLDYAFRLPEVWTNP